MSELSERIVKVVLQELGSWRGIRQELEIIELDHPDLWDSMKRELSAKVADELLKGE